MSDDSTGVVVTKYLSHATPVGAAWGAAELYTTNIFLGLVLIVYVVVWAFVNMLGLLVIARRHWQEMNAPVTKRRPRGG